MARHGWIDFKICLSLSLSFTLSLLFIYIFVCLLIFITVELMEGRARESCDRRLLMVLHVKRGQFSLWPVVTFFDYIAYARGSILDAPI